MGWRIAVGFPRKAIAIGSSWDVTREIRVRVVKGRSKGSKDKKGEGKGQRWCCDHPIESTPLTPAENRDRSSSTCSN